MSEIPEMGGGLSGFLASGLWRVYGFFPGEGTWDWLLLFVLLGLVTQALFLPYLWRAVNADMTMLDSSGGDDQSNQSVWASMWDIAWMFFYIWFFRSESGRTLLEGRTWVGSGESIPRSVYWISFAVFFACAGLVSAIGFKVDERNKAMGVSRSRQYPSRGFLSLYGGGGVHFVDGKMEECVTVLQAAATVRIVALVCYWYWSPASVSLMYCFLLGAILADGFRMLFVYIAHKRTFG